MAVWVRFGVQLDYSCRLKSVSSDGENRVHPLLRQMEHHIRGTPVSWKFFDFFDFQSWNTSRGTPVSWEEFTLYIWK